MSLVLKEHPATGVVILRMNRPEARNALNTQTRHELAQYFGDLANANDVACVIVTGDERAFVAGADLKEMASVRPTQMTQSGAREMWKAIAEFPKPIIAAVNGFALGGGCELAMHADIIIAGENAIFGQPEVRVGIIPGGGGTQRLVRAVGKFRAMKILLTGEPVTASEALAMGLASEVVADDKVVQRAIEVAKTIAALPPIAIRHIKEVVLAGQDCPLDAALLLERRVFDLMFDTEDQTEGMTAFVEKRQPNFKGK